MSLKWVCDECAQYCDRAEGVCIVKTDNNNARKPDRCPWKTGIITPVWTRVKKSKKEE